MKFVNGCTRFSRKPAAQKSFHGISNKVLLYRTIFPHMAGWLPEAEAAQLRFEFDTEMGRLKAA